MKRYDQWDQNSAITDQEDGRFVLYAEAQDEIDELVEMLENMVFNSNLHHNDAVELLHKYKGE